MIFKKQAKNTVDSILSAFSDTINALEELSLNAIDEANSQEVVIINARTKKQQALDESKKALAISAKLTQLIKE